MEQVLQTLKEIENGTSTSTGQAQNTVNQIPLILQDFCLDYSNATNDVTLR